MMKKRILLFFIILMFTIPFIRIPIVNANPDNSITYDADTNIITVIGYNESVPCTFNDLWDADKEGKLILEPETTYTNDTVIYLDYQIRPADDKALRLNIRVQNEPTGQPNLTIAGYDLFGLYQTEDLALYGIPLYPYTFYSVTYWSFISLQTVVLNVNEPASVTFYIYQGTWGVMWKTGDNQFRIDSKIVLGNGTVAGTTWFADTNKEVTLSNYTVTGNAQTIINVKNYAHLRFGELIDATTRRTKEGVSIIFDNSDDRAYCNMIKGVSGAEVYLYSSSFTTIVSGVFYQTYLAGVVNGRIWNSLLDAVAPSRYVNGDFSRVTFINGYYGIIQSSISYADDLLLYNNNWNIYLYLSYGGTIRNSILKNPINTQFRATDLTIHNYLINVEADVWSFDWLGTSTKNVYRQYEFDLSTNIGANVTISNDYLGTSDSWIIGSNGSIPTQTYSYGHYNQTGGDTIYDYNPYRITISLRGYRTYTTLFNITKKEDLSITLQHGNFGSGFFIALLLSGLLTIPVIAVVVATKR